MPVEIRELVIKTNIVSNEAPIEKKLQPEQLLLLNQKVVQDCLKMLKNKTAKKSFDR